MKGPSRISALSLVLLTFALSFAGCGEAPTKVEPRPNHPFPDDAPLITGKGEPGTFGGRLVIALPNEISTFNPYLQSSEETGEILHQIYGRLVGFDPVSRELQQDGLTTYSVQGKKVTVTLRPGLQFSNGKAITADDLLYSFKIALDPKVKSPLADMLAVSGNVPKVEKVEKTSPESKVEAVELTFVDTYPAIGYVLAQMPLVSAGADPEFTIKKGEFDQAFGLDTKPSDIGCSGPFRVESYDKTSKTVVLKFNEWYWKRNAAGARLPYLDFVEYHYVPSADALAKGLQEGKYHLAVGLNPASFDGLGAGNDKFEPKNLQTGFGTWQLIANIDIKSSPDKRVLGWLRTPGFREAMSKLINRDEIAKGPFAGKAKPVYSPVTAANTAWVTAEKLKEIGYDVEGAKKTLEKAGYKLSTEGLAPQLIDPGNKKVEINLVYPKEEPGASMGKAIIANFAAQGIVITPREVPQNKVLESLVRGAYQLAIYRVGGFSSDPITYMPLFLSNGAKHFQSFTPPSDKNDFEYEVEVNKLMRQQQEKDLADARKAAFLKVQKILADNNGVICIVADDILLAASKQLGNYQPVTTLPHATWNSELLFIKK